MKKFGVIVIYVLSILILAGCASLPARVKVDSVSGAQTLPLYSGPKARIAIADFEVKAAKASSEVGQGLREILTTSLLNTNRFSLFERQPQNIATQDKELPDLLITVAVTEFEPLASGGKGGIGGGGGVGSGTLGGLLGVSLNKAHMSLDIHIVDASTSEVLAYTRTQGQASVSDIAGAMSKSLFASLGSGSGLSAYANTPMEKAIRVCIIEATRYILQATPDRYYRD